MEVRVTRQNFLTLLWILLAVYAVYIPLSLMGQIQPPLLDISISVFLPAIFAFVHSVVRYKVKGAIAFFVICFVISNFFENLSIITGFPFGHYYYTSVLGPKLFLVPLLIGPGYYGTGYLAWALATILVGQMRKRADALTTFVVPFAASFMMVGWDVCFDPDSSTLSKQWIWRDGGGYFGVPLTNYLGWFFTVYVFLQVFSLYLRKYDSDDAPASEGGTYPLQAVLFYALIAIGFPLEYLVAKAGEMMKDERGVSWSVRDFRETAAIVSIYTMFFAVSLCLIKLAQRKHATSSS